MATVGVVSGSLYWRTHSLSRLAWSWVGGRLAPFYIHQMNRVSQWLCHDDSTINIVLDIIIFIIIKLYIIDIIMGHQLDRLMPFWQPANIYTLFSSLCYYDKYILLLSVSREPNV